MIRYIGWVFIIFSMILVVDGFISLVMDNWIRSQFCTIFSGILWAAGDRLFYLLERR